MSDQGTPDYVTSDADDYSSNSSDYNEIESGGGDNDGNTDDNNDDNKDEANDQQESVHLPTRSQSSTHL